MSIVMTTNVENEVQQKIKEYIDSVGDAKIEKYHNDDMKYEYKSFIDNFIISVKPFCKQAPDLKKSVDLIKKIKKEKRQNDLHFFKLKYEKAAELVKFNVILNDFLSFVTKLDQKILSLKKRNKYEKWIDWALNNGKGIYLATHVAKLSHSSSKSSSIDNRYFERNSETKKGYLTSVVNKDTTLDRAYTDNALSSIAKLYHVSVSDSFVGDFLREDGYPILKIFTDSDEKALNWSEAFKIYIREDKKNSHFLSKQIYFSIGEGKYHLLMPLVSSSLAHAIFSKFKEFFDDENEQIRKQKDNKKYHEKLAVSYPNRATLKVTQSNHSNASSLNGKRGGRLTLLSTMPPKWTGQQKLPINQSNLFNKNLAYKLRQEINDFQRLLLVIKSKEINMKKPEMQRAIVNNLDEIANALFDEINKINLLSGKKAWTVDSKFPLHQQLLLEPDREDDIATDEKIRKNWQVKIAEDFSFWLNKQLKHKNLNLTPIQQRLWKDIFAKQLREFVTIQEAV